jgi:hypothetical protein
MGFAYGGSISGTVMEPSPGSPVPWASITVQAAETGLLVGTASADASGHFSVAIPAPGEYLILAAQFGYLPMAAPVAIEISEAAPDPAVNLALRKAPPAPAQTPPARSWGTGTGKSFLVPTLEIPGFLTLLSLYDRHAYPNQVEGGKKVYSATLSSTWYHIVHENWEIDQDPFAVNQFGHPYQGADGPGPQEQGTVPCLALGQIHEPSCQTLALGGRRDSEGAQHGCVLRPFQGHMTEQPAILLGHPAIRSFEALRGQIRLFQQGQDKVQVTRSPFADVHGASGKT